MIGIAKSKADDCQIKNIDFANTSIFDERYKRGSFDAILVFYIFHLLKDTNEVMQRINELLVTGGLIISATPCMGEKPLYNSLLSIGYKIGIAPEIVAFKFSELNNFFVKAHFEIIESDFLKKNSPEYWLIAKKLKSA
jgi:2-polyprenyl-3-methyl-5-hydroxy-6-metoxy-1,4-benzoquinol methylase